MLIFLHLGSRRVWISPCTQHPDSARVSQQARNFLMVAEDMDIETTILMRDNDKKYSQEFDGFFKSADVKIKRNTLESPNLRAHVERFIQTLKLECLDKFVSVAEQHLNHVCGAWSPCAMVTISSSSEVPLHANSSDLPPHLLSL